MDRYEFDPKERVALEKLNIPMTIYQFIDRRVVTLLVTDGMVRLMGQSREEIIQLFDTDMYRDTHPDDKARVADAALKFASGGEQFDVVYRTMSHLLNDYVIIHSHGAHYFTEDGTMLSTTQYMVEGLGADSSNPLTEKLASNFNSLMTKESLIRDNFYDTLTGIPNMSYFIQLANAGKSRMMAEGMIPVLVYLDLAGMKYYNQKYGLQDGDILLVEFANILKRYFPNENCGRLGQDHFALFGQMDDLEDTIKSIFYDFKKCNDGRSLPVHVGIYPASFEDVPAATALDRAKIVCDMQKGVYNSVYAYYTAEVHNQSKVYNYVLNTFEKAMDEGWIRPYYQPIIRSINGMVCDEEALCRWNDPNKGMIPPDKFIGILEDANLIHRLDLYMVDRILSDMNNTKSKGIPLVPVSINLSKQDFKLCDIIGEIEERVLKAGIDPSLISIEITESVSEFDESFVKAQIDKIHRAGFTVWMDDFGSGYSTLNMLQTYDFDTIKFDMKFMREFNVNKRSHTILFELMMMASKLNINTVVEGVESLEQVKFLREIGADKMQGFYWGKACSLEERQNIYLSEIGNPPESTIETDYFDSICKANLIEPDIEEDYGIDSDEYFGPLPMGIIEFADDSISILRYNKTYAKFLLKTDFIDRKDLGMGVLPVKRRPEPGFMKTVERCIETGKWETVFQSNENGYITDVFLKLVSINPITHAAAIEIVIASITN